MVTFYKQLVEIDTGKTCYYDMENENWRYSCG